MPREGRLRKCAGPRRRSPRFDYGKYKYQAQKKAAEARKRQKVVEVGDQARPMTTTITT
jgi:hypothetical protein